MSCLCLDHYSHFQAIKQAADDGERQGRGTRCRNNRLSSCNLFYRDENAYRVTKMVKISTASVKNSTRMLANFLHLRMHKIQCNHWANPITARGRNQVKKCQTGLKMFPTWTPFSPSTLIIIIDKIIIIVIFAIVIIRFSNFAFTDRGSQTPLPYVRDAEVLIYHVMS